MSMAAVMLDSSVCLELATMNDLVVQAVELGAAKANLPVLKCFMLSIMGGIFIGFGGALAVSVGPNCPGLASSNPGLLKILTGRPLQDSSSMFQLN